MEVQRRGEDAPWSALGLSVSFATSMFITRAISYVEERNRPFPTVRSFARRVARAPRDDGPRYHHFLTGIALTLASGAATIVLHRDGPTALLSLPFGAGAAMIGDEISLLLGRPEAYWTQERLALGQGAAASVVAVVLAARLRRSGARALRQPDLAVEASHVA